MIVLKKTFIEEFAVKQKSIALAMLAAGIAAVAAAQTAAPTKIGVIQIQSALVATKDGQKAAKELEDKMAPRKNELDGKQAELRDLQAPLPKGGNTLVVSSKQGLTLKTHPKTTTCIPPPLLPHPPPL